MRALDPTVTILTQCLQEEHYGELPTRSDDKPRAWETFGATLSVLASSPRIPALAAASTLFEGAIYIFVFFWTPSLTFAHAHSLPASSLPPSPLPLGIIFSSLMCATLMGSLLHPYLSRFVPSPKRLLVCIFVLSAFCIITPVFTSAEQGVFWAFMLFEACIGAYFPTMSYLKGEVVDEDTRATMYGLMRLPLNGYVVLILGALSAGDEDTHEGMIKTAGMDWAFTLCGGLLVAVVPVIRRWL